MLLSIPRPPARIAPGIVHLPGMLDLEQQRRLVEQSREIARQVAGTPVSMHRRQVGTGQMEAYILSLGYFWATNPYRLVREVDGYKVPPVPQNFQVLADDALAQAYQLDQLVGNTVRAETALVNYYPPGTGMGMHVDAEEEANNAVISVSMGDETVFRIESATGTHEVLLTSGDVIVFGGPARRAKHGVLGVRDGTGPAGTGLKEGRINITIRQVVP
ncbi:alpha-ketoglutarate-dependent dioxygenase AlkB [Corynebacterium cystitidis]|uniref:alpha-ketoglutarate-dependent dioxygenase AlkB n=1 Tax=Corynebacterium cystitidis TaxID=35757 RepID=UPI00211EFBB5|nr:alpha-ketoglutarate-dependent dioxygenase AlkB [Corynebacterium cystitidis]